MLPRTLDSSGTWCAGSPGRRSSGAWRSSAWGDRARSRLGLERERSHPRPAESRLDRPPARRLSGGTSLHALPALIRVGSHPIVAKTDRYAVAIRQNHGVLHIRKVFALVYPVLNLPRHRRIGQGTAHVESKLTARANHEIGRA